MSLICGIKKRKPVNKIKKKWSHEYREQTSCYQISREKIPNLYASVPRECHFVIDSLILFLDIQ